MCQIVHLKKHIRVDLISKQKKDIHLIPASEEGQTSKQKKDIHLIPASEEGQTKPREGTHSS